MTERAAPAVEKFVRDYQADVVVRYNPRWTQTFDSGEDDGKQVTISEPGKRWMICQSYVTLAAIDGLTGIACTRRAEMPVLFIPQAQEIDRRWIHALEAARWSNIRKECQDAERSEWAKQRKKLREDTRDWAKDEWRSFNRWADQFNFAVTTAKDPRRTWDEIRQRNGRDIEW